MIVRTLAPLALFLAAGGCRAAPETPPPEPRRPTLGLMTSLPIYWTENSEFGAILASESPPGWVRQALEEGHVLEPLDTLEAASLEGISALILAQPRPLAPAENVALDAWVRAGGRLLLFADPMLTADSRFPIGDKRRPQDVALLSPILRHWGLELLFDEEQPEGERRLDLAGVAIPVDLAGRFREAGSGACVLSASDVMAECRIGTGRVVVLADAELLDDPEDGAIGPRRTALTMLLRQAFD